MDNDIIPAEVTNQGVRKLPEAMEKYKWQKGISGNPSGRPKKTEEEKALMQQIRTLGPKTYETMNEMLESKRTPAVAKVKLIEIILAYILGKPDSTVKLETTAEQTIEASERIERIVRSIRIVGPGPKKE